MKGLVQKKRFSGILRTHAFFRDSLFGYEIRLSRHGNGEAPERAFSTYSRRFYQPDVSPKTRTRASAFALSSPIVAYPSVVSIDIGTLFESLGENVAGTKSLAEVRVASKPQNGSRRLDAPRVPGTFGRTGSPHHQRIPVDSVASATTRSHSVCGAHRRHRFARFGFWLQKKHTGRYSAKHAALGARTLKTGQSRFFLGYKKHTFRLWIQTYEAHVLLIPLVSWVSPGNVSEGRLLYPSIQHCLKRWDWRPDVVVGDMGYGGCRNQKKDPRTLAGK
ncbi:MAG: hypothetical protein PHV34_24335 [Verrucomicrobiae bacterium]|nr:hypothetical protein [Verrucomicrobiae bacterium]